MTYTANGRTRGFTMVELLIAIIIIGILVAIIVPVLTNRAADARLAAAQADMEAIANAQSQVAIDTGYIVRLHVLDDSGAVGDGRGSDDPLDVVDSIRDEDNNLSAGNSDQIFLDAKTGVFLPPSLFVRIDVDGGPEKFGWRGPYVTFQRKTDPENPFPVGFNWVYGAPLDPWGAPYFLFVAGQSLTTGATAVGGWIDENLGDINPNFNYGGVTADARNFDRMTLLSLGPNGLPGDGSAVAPGNLLGAGDDLIRAF